MNATPSAPKSNRRKWEIVRQQDETFAASFVYAVKTTGVYCRPGCSSRLPRRENVLFFAESQDAEAAGFRPCKRCRPDSFVSAAKPAQAVARACRILEQADEAPSLDELAGLVGYSSSHFHRLFKRVVGVTPKAYARHDRMKRAKRSLRSGATVTEAIYRAGYGASSRFYEEANEQLGMTPSEYRNGAGDISVRATIVPTPLGYLLVAATEKGVCMIGLADTAGELKGELKQEFPKARLVDDEPLKQWVAEVVAHLESPLRSLVLPLDLQGSAFERRVWQALREIPVGTTRTYSELAVKIGRPKAARAVGRACARNLVAVAVPCHRAVGSDGKLRGYRWGLERKRKLLEREGAG